MEAPEKTPVEIHTAIIDWAFEHNGLTMREFIMRCRTMTATRLAQIRSKSRATEEDIADFIRALDIDRRVLTDTTGTTYINYTITHEVLHEEGRLYDTSAHRTVLDRAARNTNWVPLNKQQVRDILHALWNKQPSLL